MTPILGLLVLSLASAGDCDAKALTKELKAASPVQVANTYVSLAECDGKAAKKASEDAFSRMLSGDEANQAAVVAMGLGQGAVVRGWLDRLEPDQRSQTVAWLGEECKEQENVEAFFLESADAMGDKFWKDRYQRGLSDCRTEKIQALLSKAMANPEIRKDPTQFYAVLETYSRNLGIDALPTLGGLLAETTDEEQLSYIVNAFADAAQVGSEEGTNPDAAAKAVGILAQAGPALPPRVVEQARTTLQALGADEIANTFATYRWPERKVEGSYRYTVVGTETATCKNGKKIAVFHTAELRDPGTLWPEQIAALLPGKLTHEWAIEPGKKCKGSGEFAVALPPEPFADDKASKEWLDKQRQQFDGQTTGFDKVNEAKHDPVGL